MAQEPELSEEQMGETYVSMRLHGPASSEDIENVLVDTGATFTKISKDYADRLGIIPEYEIEVELGDGSLSRREVGYARVEIQGIPGLENLSRSVPVAFAEGTNISLLGATALEILALKVDPVRNTLKKTNPIEY